MNKERNISIFVKFEGKEEIPLRGVWRTKKDAWRYILQHPHWAPFNKFRVN